MKSPAPIYILAVRISEGFIQKVLCTLLEQNGAMSEPFEWSRKNLLRALQQGREVHTLSRDRCAWNIGEPVQIRKIKNDNFIQNLLIGTKKDFGKARNRSSEANEIAVENNQAARRDILEGVGQF